MILWWAKWGKDIKFLRAMEDKGRKVPALESMPELPGHLLAVSKCYSDIVQEGKVRWADCVQWAETYGFDDSEYLWDVVNGACSKVLEWQRSNQPPQKPPSPKSNLKAGVK